MLTPLLVSLVLVQAAPQIEPLEEEAPAVSTSASTSTWQGANRLAQNLTQTIMGGIVAVFPCCVVVSGSSFPLKALGLAAVVAVALAVVVVAAAAAGAVWYFQPKPPWSSSSNSGQCNRCNQTP